MRLVYLSGPLLKESMTLKRQLRPKPVKVPKATEKEEVGELEYHLQDGFEGELAGICESEFGDSSEQDDSNCIIDDALSKKNSIQNGILVRLHEMKKYFD